MSETKKWYRSAFCNLAVSKLPYFLVAIVSILFFQNCSNFDLSGSVKSFNGYPYEGKLYAESSPTPCSDGSSVRTRIRYFDSTRAELLRADCQNLETPVALPTNSFTVDPNDADVLRYENRTLLAEQSNFSWSVKEPAPQLQNPLIITLPNDIQLSPYGCGLVYALFDADLAGRDVLIIQDPNSGPLTYPLQINTGNYRNLIVRGLHFEIAPQAGCFGAQQAEHFEIPGHKALDIGFTQGTAFIEGVFIDMLGADADCMVTNYQNSGNAANAKITIQNSACWGSRGMGGPSLIGGGFLQDQSSQGPGTLIFENTSMHAGCQGIILTSPTGNVTLRNYDFQWDARYVVESTCTGPAFIGASGLVVTVQSVVYENAHSDPAFGFYRDDSARYGEHIPMLPGMIYTRPAAGDFAPRSKVGLSYRSPHP